ncbi:MAG: hypothetical protein NTV43_13255 [Methylococcales bacterium]|nr:hypothetical protein [Methylococcales bacterium]
MNFTCDNELVTKYKILRKKLYRTDPKFIGFREFAYPGAEDYHDPDNQMLIIHDDQNVYGGVSLRISTPNNPILLNLEKDILPSTGEKYFSLKARLPELRLNECAYAEFDNLVLCNTLRTGNYIRRLFQLLLKRCIDHRVHYMFGMGDNTRVRLYRQIYINLNVDGGIHRGIDVPMRTEYEDKKMYIVFGEITKFHTKSSGSGNGFYP